MLSEKSIINNVRDIADNFVIGKYDTILIARPLYHCAVLTGEFLTALIKWIKIRFYSEIFNPPKMLELIHKYKITAFCGTSILISMMVKSKRTDDCYLRYICISDECMEKEIRLNVGNVFSKGDIYHITAY